MKKRGARRRKIRGERKSTKVEPKFRGEFRYNNSQKSRGHPAFIFKWENEHVLSFGITSSDRTRGKKNIPLHSSPNPNNKSKMYLRPTPIKDHRANFDRLLVDWKWCEQDEQLVKDLIEKYLAK